MPIIEIIPSRVEALEILVQEWRHEVALKASQHKSFEYEAGEYLKAKSTLEAEQNSSSPYKPYRPAA